MDSLSKVAPGVTIVLGGKPHTMIFNFLALRLIEKETGKSCFGSDMFNNPTATDLLILVWAGLEGARAKEQPKWEIDDIARQLDLSDMQAIGEALRAGFAQVKVPSDSLKKTSEESAEKSVPAPS